MKRWAHNDVATIIRDEILKSFQNDIYNYAGAFSGVETTENKLRETIKRFLPSFRMKIHKKHR